MDPDSSPTETQAQQTLDASFAVLELCLEQLTPLAPVDDPQEILDLLPTISGPSQRLVLAELIKYDLSCASEQGLGRTLEFYWPQVADILPQAAIPFDLVLEEVQLLRAAGQEPKWADYRQRFPDLADTIGKWLAGGDTQAFSAGGGHVPELPIGQQFDDFQVHKQLGQGAFARVYLARQVSMHRLVALKATTRGSDEPQALSQLDHANIVRVYDQRQVTEPPTILLYMQYVAGGTLADCIKQVRELPRENWTGKQVLKSIDHCLVDANQTVPEQSSIRAQVQEMEWAEVVAWIGIQLARGLDYADDKGVLHRDVKPANILLSAEAIPKLVDFNVSCSGLNGRAGAAVHFGGSLAYMSPEQLQVADPTDRREADELDGRSDLYSLGIVLWELWQGKRPWALHDVAANWTEAVLMQKDLRHRDCELQFPANTPAERVLERVLRGLMQVDPEERPSSGNEVAARLRFAFYPELANRFEPPKESLAGRLMSLPVLLLSAILIFGPNMVASRFNYLYNYHRMGDKAEAMRADAAAADIGILAAQAAPSDGEAADAKAKGKVSWLWGTVLWLLFDLEGENEHPVEKYFRWTSYYVNIIVYALGLTLFATITLPFARIVHAGKQGKVASQKDVHYLWTIGYRSTLIAFILWVVSGLVFVIAMWTRFTGSFSAIEALHFFLSLLLCGGVAWIYPYFGMTLLALMVYYPRVIAPAMSDPNFDKRSASMRKHSSWYLLSAAAIPLTAIFALVLGELHANWVLTGIVMTALGLAFAFYAYRKIDSVLTQFTRVLGTPKQSVEI